MSSKDKGHETHQDDWYKTTVQNINKRMPGYGLKLTTHYEDPDSVAHSQLTTRYEHF